MQTMSVSATPAQPPGRSTEHCPGPQRSAQFNSAMIELCSAYFYPFNDKLPDTHSLRKEGFVLAGSLRMWFIMDTKAWWQEHEATGQIAPIVRKQREVNTGA